MIVDGTSTSTTVGATAPIMSSTLGSTATLETLIPSPTSFPINPVVTQTTVGGFRPQFLLTFTVPFAGREYPYGMSVAMMADLQMNTSMYADNAMIVAFPFNPYLTLGSSINSLRREGWSQEGLGYIPQAIPPLTNNSPMDVRKHMDDSKHAIVNMLTQQIGTIFNPLIQNTNYSYQQLAH